MGKLDGKVAVVTGSGRGIGKATVELFSKEGAFIVVSDIDEGVVKETVAGIEAAGGKVVGCVCDVTKAEDCQKLMDTAVNKFGKLDILVNNAGIIRDSMLHKMTDQQWDICIDINLKGTFNCIRAASNYMRQERHGGRIINLASLAGLMGNAGQINYAAAKAGVIGLTKAVAKEWDRFGITCNAVAYGFVESRLTDVKETSEDVMGEKMGLPQQQRDAYLAQIGNKTMKPEDAAKFILFFASDDARFVTGQVLNISAGLYI